MDCDLFYFHLWHSQSWSFVISFLYIFFNSSVELGISLSSKYFMNGIFDLRGYAVIPSSYRISWSFNLWKSHFVVCDNVNYMLYGLKLTCSFVMRAFIELKKIFSLSENFNFLLTNFFNPFPIETWRLLFQGHTLLLNNKKNNDNNDNDNNNITTKPRTAITTVNKNQIYSTYPMLIFQTSFPRTLPPFSRLHH